MAKKDELIEAAKKAELALNEGQQKDELIEAAKKAELALNLGQQTTDGQGKTLTQADYRKSQLRNDPYWYRNGSGSFYDNGEQSYARDESTGELVPTQQAEANIPVTTPVKQAVIQQPQSEQATVTPVAKNKYLYDYDNTTMADAYKQGNHTPREIMLDRYKWGQENGQPMNWIEASYFQNTDLDKTKEDAEKEEKRKKWEDAFEHMGYGLISLGNFVGALTGAPAPSSTVNHMELTDRQRKIREATRAQRQAYNKDFFSNYWKERAEERQRENAESLARHRGVQDAVAQQKADDNTRKTDATVAYYNAKTGQIEMITPAQLEKIKAETEATRKRGNAAMMNAQTSQSRESRLASGYTDESDNGRRKTVRTRTYNSQRPATSGSQSTTSGTSGKDKYAKYKVNK